MTGFRKEQFYVAKFGEEEGKRRFQETVQRRLQRASRIAKGRVLKVSVDPIADVAAGNAIQCHACGAILIRLQWTHFRTKCTISSLDEYRRSYPDAPLVAPALSDRTRVTLDNFVAVHGAEEGQRRWDDYRRKQAVSNSFAYKAERLGWTKSQFVNYNSSRAVTEKNLIARHGREDGLCLWKSYCDRQRYTNSLEYFIEREGDACRGRELWLAYNDSKGSSRRVPDIAAALGISIEEACGILSRRMAGSPYVSRAEKNFIENFELAIGAPIKYTWKTRQFCTWSHDAQAPFMYDAVCTLRKKVVEFHGDYWHARPGRYGSDFVVRQRMMTAEEIWAADDLKRQAIEVRGFSVMVVWETDFSQTGISEELMAWWNS